MSERTDAVQAAIDESNESRGQTDLDPRTPKGTFDAENELREAADRARLRSLQMSDNLNGYVREHPITSLGVAFAAGIVAGAIFKR